MSFTREFWIFAVILASTNVAFERSGNRLGIVGLVVSGAIAGVLAHGIDRLWARLKREGGHGEEETSEDGAGVDPK